MNTCPEVEFVYELISKSHYRNIFSPYNLQTRVGGNVQCLLKRCLADDALWNGIVHDVVVCGQDLNVAQSLCM